VRQAVRRLEKLSTQRGKLATFDVGGSTENPIGVESSAVIEGKAGSYRCLECDNQLKVTTHDAVVVDGRRLREVGLRCRRCGAERRLWFRIEGALLN
jgi:hypothetical protein